MATTDPTVTPSTQIAPSLAGNTIFYPLDIGSKSESLPNGISLNRPIIMFTCNGRNNSGAQYIGFPLPSGLEFSDGASYDDANLGYGGAMLAGTISSATSASDAIAKGTSAAAVASAGIDSIKNAFSNSGITDVKSDIMAGVGMSKLGDDMKRSTGIGLKMTMNKHIVTEFTGISTRSFGFKFKLVSSSAEESKVIRRIGQAFRGGLYPEANMLALKYPPTWTIRFMMGQKDIEFLPKIWECYLTSVNVSYNGSANVWHVDGSPIECDITVSFKETRALNHQDIDRLIDRPFIGLSPDERDGWKVLDGEKIYNNISTKIIKKDKAK